MLCFVLQITNTPVQYGRFRAFFFSHLYRSHCLNYFYYLKELIQHVCEPVIRSSVFKYLTNKTWFLGQYGSLRTDHP